LVLGEEDVLFEELEGLAHLAAEGREDQGVEKEAWRLLLLLLL